ncbi:hypothetical protein E2C01_016362 [Portunus trituberculatus]|uniref:Uncharacterized protein n=1 Tax=Portunus trituberculatus TaxID=210409 RepID=A0A5B7DPD0_PORTR|nr:hypothetical protein [Portunus trituberculatus]
MEHTCAKYRWERSKTRPLTTSHRELLNQLCAPLEQQPLTSPHHHCPHSTTLFSLASGGSLSKLTGTARIDF